MTKTTPQTIKNLDPQQNAHLSDTVESLELTDSMSDTDRLRINVANHPHAEPVNVADDVYEEPDNSVIAANTKKDSDSLAAATNQQAVAEESITQEDITQKGSSNQNTMPKKKNGRWGLWFVVTICLAIALLLLMLYQTLFGQMERSAKLIEIEQGQNYYGLVNDWKSEVPFFSPTIAKAFLKAKGDKSLHAGTYEIPKNPSFYQMTNILADGADSALVKVQIIEGKRASDLYKTLRSTKGVKIEVLDKPESELKTLLGLDAQTPDGEFSQNLEGWFAPNTYKYSEDTTDKKILLDLYRRQQKRLDKAWEKRAKNLPYESAYEALIMASIIEKETGLPEERAMVAGVFVNRLKKGMKLQTDPTIIYGMGDRYDGNIKRADINEKTAYNTYQINGLPPTPIALPSFASIDAALHPADTKAIFFVATGKGGHTFTETYAEHKKAVDEYLKVIKAIKK